MSRLAGTGEGVRVALLTVNDSVGQLTSFGSPLWSYPAVLPPSYAAAIDRKDVTSFRQPTCKTLRRKCIAILRPTGREGTITLLAKLGPDVKPESITALDKFLTFK